MFKFFFVCSLFLTSFATLASPMEHMMTIKDRLRISLWVEGIEQNQEVKTVVKPKRELPEEIERALRKL